MTDVTVVGSGPNGLTAAAVLARAGLAVRVLERAEFLGGSVRCAELTLPGFRHDVGAAVHPAAISSPIFRALGLADGVEFVVPDVSYAHALAPGRGVLAFRDLAATAAELGRDGARWRRLLGTLVERIDAVGDFTSGSILRVPADLRTAFSFAARVAVAGLLPPDAYFRDDAAGALLAGTMAHANTRQPTIGAAAVGLVLAAHAHARGWPVPVGGSHTITEWLVADIRRHGGEFVTGIDVDSPGDVGPSRAILLDTTPAHAARFAGDALPRGVRRALERFRHGPGVAKWDAALSGPIPWADPRLASAPTVHLSGTARQLARREAAVARGEHARQPYVLLTQPTVVDPSRAPAGGHVVWAYLHVPRGSELDAREAILRALEPHAPGVRDLVLADVVTTAPAIELLNPNHVGGDILTGATDVRQLLARPRLRSEPWRTGAPGVYLCSAATAPGPGVHGMSGWHAARLAARDVFGLDVTLAGMAALSGG